MIAADEIRVGGNQNVLSDRDATCRENLAVEPDVRTIGQLNVAVLARENGIAADEDAVADLDASIIRALRVEQAVVVDDDVVADENFVRMTQHDVLAEDHIRAAGTQKHRV